MRWQLYKYNRSKIIMRDAINVYAANSRTEAITSTVSFRPLSAASSGRTFQDLAIVQFGHRNAISAIRSRIQ